MIVGSVSPDRDPIIELRLLGRNGREEEVSVVMDTGFRGSFCLPPDLVARLGFSAGPPTVVELAGKVVQQFATVEVTLLWDGRPREVSALQAPGEILAGMSLLDGYSLTVDGSIGGEVFIERNSP